MVKKKKGMHQEKSGKKSVSTHAEDENNKNSDQKENHSKEEESLFPDGDEGSEQDDISSDQVNAEAGQEAGDTEQDTDDTFTVLEEKLQASENKYLRLAAEFDNYRKRTLREKAELTKLAGEDFITGLLPVIDDFDRAVDSMNNSEDAGALKKGVELIHGKLREFLKQKGVKEVPALGNEFDTDLHEAVTKIPVSSKKEKGKIADVILKGYMLHDKVIRYAKVVVGE